MDMKAMLIHNTGSNTVPRLFSILNSVVDPHHVDADPDSTYHPDADPDPDFI
jgi:hypothetical protein